VRGFFDNLVLHIRRCRRFFFVSVFIMSTSKSLGSVLCYGIFGIDQIVQVTWFPERDGHTRVLHDEEFIGGEAANTAVTLGGLGVDVRLMGCALGEDRRGALFLRAIRQFAVDARGIDVDLIVRTGHAIILSDAKGGRTICGHFPDLRSRPLTKADLEGVALLSVDPFLGENAVRAARLARARDVAVFAIELAADHPLAELCDVVINSAGFMRRHKMGSVSDVALALLKEGVETVVITQGQKGSQVFQENGNSFQQSIFRVAARDTTGAGDAFWAGLIYGYLQGWTLTHSVKFASGSAALTCAKIGGAGHIYSEDQVLQLIAEA
jgi:sugar/nucleoside kinase (ribokinase family)